MIQKKRNNQLIEVFRSILIIGVVFAHFHLSGDADTYAVAFVRSAVPFFLIVSGYFAYRTDNFESAMQVRKKIRNMFYLILKIAVVYTIVNTAVCLINGEPPLYWFTEKYLSVEALCNFLLFNRARFFCSVAYYLFMVVYVYAVYLLLLRYNAVKISMYFIPVLLAVNIILSEILKKDWYLVGNWLFTGLPFFLFGVLLRMRSLKLKRKQCILLIVLGVISTFTEAYFIHYNDVFVYIGTILLSSGMFLFCQSCENVNLPVWPVKFGSECSVYIFLYHCAVGYLLTAIFEKMGIPINSLFPFIVIIVTVIIGFVVLGIKKGIKSRKVG